MNTILNQLAILILLVISRLPMAILYYVSNGLYYILHYVIKYRLKVVRGNLKRSFPDKKESELKTIEKQYYAYLCDLVVETVKGFTAGKKEFLKRIRFKNIELLNALHNNKVSALIIMGHTGNWEWICRSAPFFMKNKIIVAYKPLSNPYFDRLMYKTRTEFGVNQVPMTQIGRYLIKEKDPFLLILLSDQSPTDAGSSYWTDFLNQETAVMQGAEKLAEKFNLPMYYLDVKRNTRGHYICKPELIIEVNNTFQTGEITEIHTRFLENEILKQPEIWIWSHKRWKLNRS